MSVTVEIAGLPPERIVFTPSPLGELGTALHALSEPGHHPAVHGWTTATNAALKPDLADRLCDADFLWRTTFADIFMGFAGLRDPAAQPGATLADDLDTLDRLPDEDFVAAALEFTCVSTYGKAAPSPLADPQMRERAMDLAAARGQRQMDFTNWLLTDPTAVREWIRRLFEDCDQAFFADTWRRTRVHLAADARHKTELLRHKGLAAALESVSQALTLDEHGTRIEVDKMADGRTTAVDPAVGVGLTLVPTTFNWPHLTVLHRPGWRPVLHYPVASGDLPGHSSVEALTLRMEALSHPLRMRLCRSVARAPYTTGELAGILGLTAPEVSRHLSVLKKAGLLTTRRRGRYVQHQLDLSIVAKLGSDFLETVLR
ncbi:DUF5937 family protein [Streptomyces daliensis]|uniref:Winged helix-turn-helix transcriptional regulator n=1 Tax=Streptomyces daliensis TaxID=299421 RepID=A0A8T4J194_9ACTN|nr:winged helix-turn-helix transcriptional regulator [Streptomyces daliensis]